MKKRLMLGLTGVVMLVTLAGCGNVKLCEYKGVKATKVNFEVSDEEVQEAVLEGMYDYATYEEVKDRAIQEGDYVVLDYKATIDGKSADAYSGEEEEIYVGGGYIYPEVEEALIGMKKAETKTVEFELTEEYAEEGDEGKKVSMEIKVREITEEILPEYNESYVKENTDYESVEDYEAAVKLDLMATKEEEYKYFVTITEILDTIAENSTFKKYPEDLYKKCEEEFDDEMESGAAMYGMEVADYMEINGYDEETKKQEVEKKVEQELIISEIAKKEQITCTDEEVKQYVDENYEAWGYESAEEFFKEFPIEEMKNDLLFDKVVDFLYEHAKFKEISEEEYLAAQEAEYPEEEMELDASDEEEE